MLNLSEFMQQETFVRMGLFASVLGSLSILEIMAPRRLSTEQKSTRWVSNFGLGFTNTIAVHSLLPFTMINFSLVVQEAHIGLLFLMDISTPLRIALAVISLDLIIYFQHRLFHRLPWMWRFHQVHHSDIDLDTSSALRIHPIEIMVSIGMKLSAITLLGAPVIAVLIFELALALTALFTHANIKIPLPFEKRMRYFLVTPDMHRIHHSVVVGEMNSNYGFCIPWWDRLFGSYRATPTTDHPKMNLGLTRISEADNKLFISLLKSPFRTST